MQIDTRRNIPHLVTKALLALALAMQTWGALAPLGANALSPKATAISTGGQHSCAALSTGGVVCWGHNGHGELGNNSDADSDLPRQVVGLSGSVKMVVGGAHHSCALLSSGAVNCWGRNQYGQIGNNQGVGDYWTAQSVNLNSAATAIAAGDAHTCALLNDHTVWCWGGNGNGELGLGNPDASRHPAPGQVVDLADATAIATGGAHTCALLTSGAVKCWGFGVWGQLGIGADTYADTDEPTVAAIASGVKQITAGYTHTCALLNTGGVKCWGSNQFGELGYDAAHTPSSKTSTPQTVPGLAGVKSVAAGQYHTCAVTGTGINCWGYNQWGQVGDDSYDERPLPAAVVGLGNTALAVVGGWGHSCALLKDGSVQCWGSNTASQLGRAAESYSPKPVYVVDLAGTPGKAGIPALTNPAPRSVTNASTIKWTWKTTPNAVQYDLQVAAVSNFPPAGLTVEQSLSPGVLTYEVTIADEGVYFWRVRGKNSAGEPGP